MTNSNKFIKIKSYRKDLLKSKVLPRKQMPLSFVRLYFLVVLFANSLAYKNYCSKFIVDCQRFCSKFIKYFLSCLRKVDMTMFSTYEKIKELAEKQGISLNKLEEKLGYSRNTIYNMRRSTPNSERISEIADYFHVSTDYLLGRTDNPRIADEESIVPDDIDKIIDNAMMFDGKPLTDDDRKAIRGIISGYMDSKEK